MRQDRVDVRQFAFAYLPNNPTGRLTLGSVQEIGTGNLRKPPHHFQYNPGYLPNIMSKSQDHWGYFNGASNASLLAPARLSTPQGPFEAPGGDRAVHPAFTQTGMLTKLIYPTGGYTTFEYENNEYSYVSSDSLSRLPTYATTPVTSYLTIGTSDLPVSPNVNIGCGSKTQLFTITPNPSNPSERRSVHVQWGGSNLGRTGDHRPYVQILDSAGAAVYTPTKIGVGTCYRLGGGPSNDGYLMLPPGKYRLLVYACNPFAEYTDQDPVQYPTPCTGGPYAEIQVQYVEYRREEPLMKKLAGGLRIKTVHDFTSPQDLSPQVRRYSYQPAHDSTRSTGVIYAEPRYVYEAYQWFQPYAGSSGNAGSPWMKCEYWLRVASSPTMLGMTQGSPVGYRLVTEWRSGNAKIGGKTVYRYTSPVEYPDELRDTPPFVPPVSSSYMTGLLVEQTDYVAEANGFAPVKNMKQQYQNFFQGITGASAIFPSPSDYVLDPNRYITALYELRLGQSQPQSRTERLYDPQSQTWHERVTAMTYNEGGTLLATKTAQVDGGTEVQRYFYPSDYSFPSATLQAMAGPLHVFAPIEVVTERAMSGVATVIAATYNAYAQLNGKLRLISQSVLRTPQPISKAGYGYSIGQSGGGPESRFSLERVMDRYDGAGNVVQLHQVGAPPVARLWGEGDQELIAEAVNAPYMAVAATSFEAKAPGRWRYLDDVTTQVRGGPTGRRAHRLAVDQSIMRDSLPAGTYTVSVWATAAPTLEVNSTSSPRAFRSMAQAPSGWQQYELTVELVGSSNTVALHTPNNTPLTLDELRLYPAGARLNTYTYDPLIGQTSHTNPSGRTVTYEYDGLGRLVRTRDEQGRVLSQQQYHYARP